MKRFCHGDCTSTTPILRYRFYVESAPRIMRNDNLGRAGAPAAAPVSKNGFDNRPPWRVMFLSVKRAFIKSAKYEIAQQAREIAWPSVMMKSAAAACGGAQWRDSPIDATKMRLRFMAKPALL